MSAKTVTDLKNELRGLTDYYSITRHPDVVAAMEKVRKQNAPRVAELEKQIAALRESKPAPKPRWPENTQADMLETCKQFWGGTTEFRSFRIHCWNDVAVWTGYPGKAYWSGREQKYGKSCFVLLKRGHKKAHFGDRGIQTLYGRVSLKQMQAELDKLK